MTENQSKLVSMVQARHKSERIRARWNMAIEAARTIVACEQRLMHRSLGACKIISNFLRGTPHFGKMSALVLLRLGQRLVLKHLRKGDTVFLQNDPNPTTAFTVVFGCVDIVCNPDLHPDDLPDLIRADKLSQAHARQTFGEIALLSATQARTTSAVVASEEAAILQLDKEDWEIVDQGHRKDTIGQKIHQLGRCELFRTCADSQLQLLQNHMTHRIVKQGEVILEQGARADTQLHSWNRCLYSLKTCT